MLIIGNYYEDMKMLKVNKNLGGRYGWWLVGGYCGEVCSSFWLCELLLYYWRVDCEVKVYWVWWWFLLYWL